jgi:hypothetical protein
MNTKRPQQPKPANSPIKTIAATLISTSIQIVSMYNIPYIRRLSNETIAKV